MNLHRLKGFSRSCATAPRAIGLVPACQWIFSTIQYNLKFNNPEFVKIQPRFLRFPVKLRARTSDPFVFRQIMIENEYLPLKDLSPLTLLDLGANIGLASSWFLSQFPEVRVFAVEADRDNYALCCENLAAYGDRAKVIHAAVWSGRKMLVLHRKSCSADSHVEETARQTEQGEEYVQGVDVASLIAMSGFERVNLMKIDIEGAEKEIFRCDSGSWLSRVDNLCIELHGDPCRNTFFQALVPYTYVHSQSGELDFCRGLRPRPALGHS